MDLIAKLPGMEDTALAVLHENAQRLIQTGTKAQQESAVEVIPAIEAELATRREAKLSAAKEAMAVKRAAAAEAKAKAKEAKGEEAKAKEAKGEEAKPKETKAKAKAKAKEPKAKAAKA